MITKCKLKEQIPHGMLKKVAEKAGVSHTAVSRYFDGKIKSSMKIYKAALEVANECKSETMELEKQLMS